MELCHPENNAEALMNYSFPYVLKKSDKRLRYLTVTQIKEETVSPYSLYRDPIFDAERTLGLTLLTMFSYAAHFAVLTIQRRPFSVSYILIQLERVLPSLHYSFSLVLLF